MRTGAAKERSISTSAPRIPKNRIRGLRVVRRLRVGAKSRASCGTRRENRFAYGESPAGGCQTRTHTVNSIPVYQITLGYDNVGRINTMTETGAGAAHTFDYEYDLDGQLFQVRKDGNLVEQYRYDNNANRTNTLTNSASYDEQDRLIEQGGVSYAFDTDGFLTQRGSDTFTYSTRGELLAAVVGGQTATYHYDGMARRIGKTDAGGTTQYLYGNPGNPFQLTASRDAAGILTAYFSDTAGNLFAFERSGQRYYVATDQLGTPKAVTDATGSMVKVVEYDAWGVKLSDTNPTFDLPVGFAGGIPDDATGLVRFGFRDYEPGVGRWSARDPILFRGGQGNLYGYAFNDPVNFVDPDGEAVWFAPVVYFALAKGGAIGVAYIGSKYGATFADWWNRNATDPCGSAGGGKGVGDVNRAFGKIGTIGGAEIGAFGAINAAVAAGPMVTTAILTNPQSIQKAGEVVSGFVMTSPPSTTSNAIGTGTRYITDHFGITKPWW